MASEVRLRDGTRAVAWAILPSDREELRARYDDLSPETQNHRFLASVPHLTDPMLDHLVDEVDGIDHVALALFVLDEDNVGVPAGVARMIRYTDRPHAADLAVTVADEWQANGVATALLGELMRVRPRGVTRIITTVAGDNAASLAMLGRLGATTVSPAGINRLDVTVDLAAEPADEATGRRPAFVLHEHHKPRHHFDLRLEDDGVLRSWAVPRGLPPDSGQDRLAVEVADHELEHLRYSDAEKSIADIGWWEDEGRTANRLLFTLHGRVDSVRYALIHTDRDWLVHRTKDQPPHA